MNFEGDFPDGADDGEYGPPGPAPASHQDEQAAFLLGDCFDRIEHAYRIMNWFASGKSMEQYSRVLPQDILGEVYFILAPVYEQMKVVSSPKATAHAKNWYQTKLAEEKAIMEQKIAAAQDAANERVAAAERSAEARVRKLREEVLLEIAACKSMIDGSIRKAVQKAIKSTEDRLKGKPRANKLSGRQVRL